MMIVKIRIMMIITRKLVCIHIHIHLHIHIHKHIHIHIHIHLHIHKHIHIHIHKHIHICVFWLNISMLLGQTYRERGGWAGCIFPQTPALQVMWAMATCKSWQRWWHHMSNWMMINIWQSVTLGNITWQWLPSGNPTWLGKSDLKGGFSGTDFSRSDLSVVDLLLPCLITGG